jgi:hypothetical protein
MIHCAASEDLSMDLLMSDRRVMNDSTDSFSKWSGISMGFPVHGCCPCVARKGDTPVALAVLLAIENSAKESQSDQSSCQ